MTFRVIVPHAIGAAEIAATNVALESDWIPTEPYDIGAVVLAGDGQVYQAITDGPNADPTSAGQAKWVLIGPPNRLRPFDTAIGIDQERPILTQATRADTITYTLTGLGAIMGVAVMNVAARSIGLRVTSAGGVTGDIHDATHVLRDLANVSGSLFRWLTLPIVRERTLVLTDLYWPAGSTIEITIDNTGGTAAVGAIVLGLVQELGLTLADARWSQSSRSFKVFDAYKTTIVRRYPGGGIECDVHLAGADEMALRQVLEDLDGVPGVWVPAADRPAYTIYGVLDGRPQMTGRAGGRTYLSLRVEAV